MAHPERAEHVERLRHRLDDPTIVWDQVNDVWDTGRRALQAHHSGASHVLVVQDDTIVPNGLPAACANLVEHVPPDAPVSLYMGRARTRPSRFRMLPLVKAAQARGASFAVFGGPWWGPALIVPVKHVQALVEFGDGRPGITQYDHKIGAYFHALGVDCWYTIPSLVDHNPELGSMLDHGDGPARRAAEFVGDDYPAQDHRWTSRKVTVADLPAALRHTFPPPITGTQIPRVIHQVWIGPDPVPWRWIVSWRRKHPDWTHRLWRERDLQRLNWHPANKRLYRRYTAQRRWHGAVNVARVEILHQHGGVYLDADLACLAPLDRAEFMAPGVEFWVSESANEPGRPANGAMGSVPRGRVITKYRGLLTRVRMLHPSWRTTGALLLRDALDQKGRAGADVLVPAPAWYRTRLDGTPARRGWTGPVYADHYGYSTRQHSAARRRKRTAQQRRRRRRR